MALIDFAPKERLPTLPFEPSGIIRACCDDLEWVLKQPNVTINMRIWAAANGTCEVCAAGAVILRRASVRFLESHGCNPIRFYHSVSQRLYGLDDLRSGNVSDFLDGCRLAAAYDGAKHIADIDVDSLVTRCLKEVSAVEEAALYRKPSPQKVRTWIAAARKLADKLESLGA